MKAFHLSVAAVAMALACSVQAAETKKEAAGESNPDAIVCFSDPSTGSHIKKRICMTRAERERRMKENQAALQKMQGDKTGRAKALTD